MATTKSTNLGDIIEIDLDVAHSSEGAGYKRGPNPIVLVVVGRYNACIAAILNEEIADQYILEEILSEIASDGYFDHFNTGIYTVEVKVSGSWDAYTNEYDEYIDVEIIETISGDPKWENREEDKAIRKLIEQMEV